MRDGPRSVFGSASDSRASDPGTRNVTVGNKCPRRPLITVPVGKESQILQVGHLFIKVYLSLKSDKFTSPISSQFGVII